MTRHNENRVMRVVFLPDFVAYPICYFRMLRALGSRVTSESVNYNDYWPYESVAALGAAIAGSSRCDEVDAIVGYSFGAFVAVEVADILSRRKPMARLHLIDPPDRRTLGSTLPVDIETRLKTNPAYQYLFDLIECDLTRRDCVLGNIGLLADLSATLQIRHPCTVYVAGDHKSAAARLEQFQFLHHDTKVVPCPGFDHRTIVECAAIVDELSQ
jgi:pimeloyl-ACP methyl ester carboxylesterase